MSDPTVNPKLDQVWSPADYDDTVRDAGRHRAERGTLDEAKWIPIHTVEAEQAEQIRHELGIDEASPKLPAEKMTPDVEPFLPFRRKPGTVCQCCSAWPDEKCERGCLSTMTDEQQRLHRDTVLDQILAELDIQHEAETAEPYRVMSCEVGAGRHRVPVVDVFSAYRRIRAVVVIAVVVLVLALGALWASHEANAETFDICPSGVTGVASADTSCAFAEAVRTSFYWNPSWTIFAKSPVTGKFYTMQCSRTDTTGTGWSDSKRCYGINDAGVALIVFIA